MLTCQEVTELVTDYLEGRLSLAQRMSFQMHIGMCRRCRAYLRQMKVTVRTLGKLPDAPMPVAVRDELLARFRNARPHATAVALPVPWPVRVLAAIEKVFGGTRGWMLAGLMFGVVLIYAIASGLQPGPLGEGLRCVLAEAGMGGAALVALGITASSQRAHLSPATWTAFAMAGSLGGFAVLEAMCPSVHVGPHVLVFHVGGVLLAGAMGVAASRLPALR